MRHDWTYPGGVPGRIEGGIWRPNVLVCDRCWTRVDRKAAAEPCPGPREETVTDVYGEAQ